jgi:ABC transporter substrate binding protein
MRDALVRLMAYMTSYYDLFRREATFIDKIFRGAKPGDLPVEHPTKFEFVINIKTAEALGLDVPPPLLARFAFRVGHDWPASRHSLKIRLASYMRRVVISTGTDPGVTFAQHILHPAAQTRRFSAPLFRQTMVSRSTQSFHPMN